MSTSGESEGTEKKKEMGKEKEMEMGTEKEMGKEEKAVLPPPLPPGWWR